MSFRRFREIGLFSLLYFFVCFYLLLRPLFRDCRRCCICRRCERDQSCEILTLKLKLSFAREQGHNFGRGGGRGKGNDCPLPCFVFTLGNLSWRLVAGINFVGGNRPIRGTFSCQAWPQQDTSVFSFFFLSIVFFCGSLLLAFTFCCGREGAIRV